MMAEALSPSSLAVDVAVRCPLWTGAVDEAGALCKTAARACYRANYPRRASGAAEVSIVLADDAFVRGLNREYRGRDKATNVLSFPASPADGPDGTPPSSQAPRMLGDVVLAFETVAAEAAAQGKTLTDHLCHLVVHGMLHLLGYDHQQEKAAEKMEAFEIEILAGLDIADPYGDDVLADAGN